MVLLGVIYLILAICANLELRSILSVSCFSLIVSRLCVDSATYPLGFTDSVSVGWIEGELCCDSCFEIQVYWCENQTLINIFVFENWN